MEVRRSGLGSIDTGAPDPNRPRSAELEDQALELLISHNPNRTPVLLGRSIRLGAEGRMGSRRR
jgi:hypothetical protein